MTLTHFSFAPIAELDARKYEQERHFKPHGLWVSVDGECDWPAWCEAESFGIGAYAHAVELREDAKIRVIADSQDLYKFSRCFLHPNTLNYDLEWRAVARMYQGIIIAPYMWDCRHDKKVSWYYTWDCASGCIWDLSAIKTWMPLGERVA